MGKWDHRPRRFFRRQRSPGPPPFYDINAPLPEFRQDGIPLWEKKYCTLVASVPWQKIVDSKKFTFCHSNVLDWNDSAAEEAFQNAKKRYWAKINSLPCDIALPDPDTYVHQIDWNPYIDPELIKEVDSAYFALPDEEQGNAIKNKRAKISVNGENSQECTGTPLSRVLENEIHGGNQGDYHVGDSVNAGNTENPWECTGTPLSRVLGKKVHGGNQGDYHFGDSANAGNTENPWECTGTPLSRVLANKVHGGNQGDYHVGDSANVDNTANPWECSITHGNGGLTDNAWGGGRVKSWGLKEGKDHNNQCRDWDTRDSHWGNDCVGIPSQKDRWGKVRDSSWCQQEQPNNLANIGNPWKYKSSQHNETPTNTGCRNSGANVSGWKQQENAGVSSDLQLRRNYGGGTAWNQRFHRREGSNRHTFGYNDSQFHRDDRQTGHYWRRDKSKKRDFAP